jgi:large subunit ribosomal protein L5e
LEADDLEELYEKVHQAIREDPTREEKEAFTNFDKTYQKGIKKTYEQRKADSNAKKAALSGGGDDDEEEED